MSKKDKTIIVRQDSRRNMPKGTGLRQLTDEEVEMLMRAVNAVLEAAPKRVTGMAVVFCLDYEGTSAAIIARGDDDARAQAETMSTLVLKAPAHMHAVCKTLEENAMADYERRGRA